MAVDRVSTYGVFLSTLTNVTKVDAQLATLQNQISSGFKSQDYAGIAANSSRYLQLGDRLARIDHYFDTNSIIKARIDTTSTVLGQVIETATQLKSLILQRRSATSEVGAFDEQINASWKALTGQLNTTIDGRSIFSGSRTDSKAVNDNNFPVLSTDGVPDQGYYLGDSSELTVRVSDSVEMTYNVNAGEEAFQQIFAGLALAKQGDASNDDDTLAQAYTFVEEGLKGVISLQAGVNSNTVALDNVNQDLTSLQIYWKSVQEDIGNTDLVAASTQVAINQSILQAAFQAFARITSLRLSDFLR